MDESGKLIQCTKCRALIEQGSAMTIQFYAEHKPLLYCLSCFDAIPYDYTEKVKGRIGQS